MDIVRVGTRNIIDLQTQEATWSDHAAIFRPLQVKPGERILFGKYAGQTVKIDGEELLVMREEDVLGVVEE